MSDRPAPGVPPGKGTLLGAGSAQFAGQALGLVLALVVSHLIARTMGTGPEADAFLLGRRLITAVTEALNQVIVVVFIPLIAAQVAGGAGLGQIVLRSGGAAFAVGLGLGLSLMLAAPWIVAGVADGFAQETAALATRVVAILALALPATVATVALGAYCNVRGRFGAAAAIRQLPRAAVAGTLALGAGGLAVLAAGAYAAGAVAVTLLTLVVAWRLRHAPMRATRPSGRAATGRRGAASIVLAVGAMAALWLETAVAADVGAGAVAVLDYGQRLGALLPNTLGTALTLVVFSDLSRRAAAGEGALDTRLGAALWTGLALTLPLTIGLVATAPDLVELVLGYGAFDSHTEVTTLVRWMAVAPLGALATRMLYARVLADEGLPMVRLVGGAVAADLILRAVLFAVLVPRIGLTGVPLALLLAPLGPVLVMAVGLRGRGVWPRFDRSALDGPLMATALASSAAIAAGAWIGGALAEGAKAQALAAVGIAGTAGLAVVAVAVVVFGVRPRLK